MNFIRLSFLAIACVGILSACGSDKKDEAQQSAPPLSAENKVALANTKSGMLRPAEASQSANPNPLNAPSGASLKGVGVRQDLFFASSRGTGSIPKPGQPKPKPNSSDALTSDMTKKFDQGHCSFETKQPQDFKPSSEGSINYESSASVKMAGSQCPASISANMWIKVAAIGISMHSTGPGSETVDQSSTPLFPMGEFFSVKPNPAHSSGNEMKLDVAFKMDLAMNLVDPDLIAQNDVSKLDANLDLNVSMTGNSQAAMLSANASGKATIVSAKYGTIGLAFGGSGQISGNQQGATGAVTLYETWTFADFTAESRLEIKGKNPEDWTCTLNGEAITTAEDAQKYSHICQIKFAMKSSSQSGGHTPVSSGPESQNPSLPGLNPGSPGVPGPGNGPATPPSPGSPGISCDPQDLQQACQNLTFEECQQVIAFCQGGIPGGPGSGSGISL